MIDATFLWLAAATTELGVALWQLLPGRLVIRPVSGNVMPWIAYVGVHPAPLPVVLEGGYVAPPRFQPSALSALRPKRPKPPNGAKRPPKSSIRVANGPKRAPKRPKPGRCRPRVETALPLTTVLSSDPETGRASPCFAEAQRAAVPSDPWVVAVQADVIARWDAACETTDDRAFDVPWWDVGDVSGLIARWHRQRKYRRDTRHRTRMLYSPRYDGIRDPDPRDLVRHRLWEAPWGAVAIVG